MNAQMSITEALSQSGLEAIDFVILFTYIILLVSLGVFLSYNRDTKSRSATDYFLAGNTLTWWAVGASLIAANISTEQIIGMAGTGYADGIAIAAYELMASVVLIVIGKFLLPVMMDRKIFTFPQFLRQRYNQEVGLAFSILWLFLYILVNLTSVSWLGALAIEQIMGFQGLSINILGIDVSMRMIIVVTLFLIAGAYSIHGGMTSVAWTDVIQIIFIIGGGLATAYFAVQALAGNDGSFIEGCKNLYSFLLNKEYENDVHFHLIVQESRNPQAFANVPGLAAIVGSMWLTNLSYWAFNQYITQKGLAAHSIHEAQKGFVFAAFLKIIMPAIVIIPGICTFYLTQHSEGYQLQSTIHVSDDAYPWLIRNFIPPGIKGLAFIAITAAIISSLASMLNSTAALFTIDIYRKYIKPDATDKKIVSVGRIAAVVTLVLAVIATNPLLGGLDQAFQYIQEYSGFLYPGITIVIAFGLLWKRASTKATIWTTILTIPLGVLFKLWMPDVAFLFRAGYVFIILLILFITISLMSKKTVKSSTELPKEYRKFIFRWGYGIAAVSILSILCATVVTVGAHFLPPDASPDNNIIAYLNDIGFQAFYFFGALSGGCALLIISNAKSHKQDPKAIAFNIALFKTTRGYTIASIIICTITLLLYIMLW